jgi:hypothetical protein
MPGMVLSDEPFLRRLALGPYAQVKGGTRSKRVLFLYIPGRLCICLNCEDEQKGLERARPIIREAITAGRIQSNSLPELERWVANRVVKRLALAPANYKVERIPAARLLGLTPSMLDSFVKSVRPQPPSHMHWRRGPGGKHVLGCCVSLSDGSKLWKDLKTNDLKLAKQRIRLLLWHAIDLLPGGKNHDAWVQYGGPIPRWTKDLLKRLAASPWEEYELKREAAAERLGYHPRTIDWLTGQENARKQDPKRRMQARRDARSRALRKGKQIPKIGTAAWQFRTAGPVLERYRDGTMYGRTMIAGLLLRWSHPIRNRPEAEALAHAVVAAREDVRNAAIAWSDCPGPAEVKALLKQQARLRHALVSAGGKRSKGWADIESALKELPLDQKSRPSPEAATSWFVELLRRNPDRSPRPLETSEHGIGLLEEAAKRFNVSLREARRCYERARDRTGNRTWSTAHRGKARKSASKMASHLAPAGEPAIRRFEVSH